MLEIHIHNVTNVLSLFKYKNLSAGFPKFIGIVLLNSNKTSVKPVVGLGKYLDHNTGI